MKHVDLVILRTALVKEAFREGILDALENKSIPEEFGRECVEYANATAKELEKLELMEFKRFAAENPEILRPRKTRTVG